MRWLVTTFPDIGYKLNGEVCGQGVGGCVVSFLTLQTVHPLNQYWFFSVIMTQSLLKKQKETETDVAVFGYDETSPSIYVNMDCMMKEDVLPDTCRGQ